MAHEILIKRGQSSNLGALTLKSGELAVALDTGKVYIGTDSGKALINPDFTITDIGGAGTAASKDVGTGEGNIPVLGTGGKLDESVIPAIAISEVHEVASQSAMLALSAQMGDVAVRSDINKSFILKQAPASTIGNWVELRTPTDAVLSVNGLTGAVTITDISGNAGTATKLATSRKINGVSFDGSADITVADNTKEPVISSKLSAFNKAFETSTSNIKVAGTAAVGSADTVARADHIHPAQTTVSGNAGSATKLQTARTISLDGDVSGSGSFDGSSNLSITASLGDVTIDGGTF